MMEYRWKCLACDTANDPEKDACENCGCPAETDGEFVEGWKKSFETPAEYPSVNWLSGFLRDRVAPCPKCSQHMLITGAACPHCSYELKMEERKGLSEYYSRVFRSGCWHALWFFPLVILVAIYIYDKS